MKKYISILLIALVAITCLVSCDYEATDSGNAVLEIKMSDDATVQNKTASVGTIPCNGYYYVKVGDYLPIGDSNNLYISCILYSDKACSKQIDNCNFDFSTDGSDWEIS